MAPPKVSSAECGLYKPGHEVHWIQGLRYGDRDHPPVPGRLINVGDDGIIVVEIADAVRRFWHHDPLWFAHRAAEAGGVVELQARWGMIGIRHKAGTYVFCVADTATSEPCTEVPPQGDLLDLLDAAGGFTISCEQATPSPRSHEVPSPGVRLGPSGSVALLDETARPRDHQQR